MSFGTGFSTFRVFSASRMSIEVSVGNKLMSIETNEWPIFAINYRAVDPIKRPGSSSSESSDTSSNEVEDPPHAYFQ